MSNLEDVCHNQKIRSWSLILRKWIYNYFHKSDKIKYEHTQKNVSLKRIWNTDKDNINWQPQNVRLLGIIYIDLINILS